MSVTWLRNVIKKNIEEQKRKRKSEYEKEYFFCFSIKIKANKVSEYNIPSRSTKERE